MAGRLKGQVALVTGGGSGIGKAIAKSFAREGAFVFIASRREDKLAECLQEIHQEGGEGRAVRTDIIVPEDVEQLASLIRSEKRHLDILVNAAGVLGMGLVHETTLDKFDLIFDSNVKGLFLVTRTMIPLMKNRPNANIIHLSSIAGTRTDTGLGIYEASKAAVNTLTKVMAKELAEFRIRVNAIAPGPIDTALYKGSILGDDLEEETAHHEVMKSFVPFGRMGTPEEVARLAIFLASPESDFISGSITSIDGAMGY